jgi:gliding motility-associated-like protein
LRNTVVGVCTYSAEGIEFDPLSVSDNCGVKNVKYTLTGQTSGNGSASLAGVVFNIGITLVNWTIMDNSDNITSCSFHVTINSLPLAKDDHISTWEDVPVSGNVMSNDFSLCDLTVVKNHTDPSHGSVTIDTSGNYIYTPSANFNGMDEFNYTICDPTPDCSTATVTITINRVPKAVNDLSINNSKGVAVIVNVTANDTTGTVVLPATVSIVGGSDTDGNETLDRLVIKGQGVWNVITLTGVITFTPETGYYNDPTSIGYTVKDKDGNTSNTASVTIAYTCIPLTLPVATLIQPICEVQTGTITITSPIGETIEYSKDGINWVKTVMFSNLLANTIYNIRVRNIATDPNCVASSEFVINGQPLTPLIPIVADIVQPTCDLTSGTITITPQYSPGIIYNINSLTYTNMNNTGIFTLLPPEVYTVSIKNLSGCFSPVASVTINPVPADCGKIIIPPADTCTVIVPNSFSPNADGINDVFKVNCLSSYDNPIMEIFNRWGNKVFKKDHYGNVDYWGSETDAWWDGRSDNKLTIGNQDLPVGTYFYVFKLKSTKILTGFIFLNK